MDANFFSLLRTGLSQMTSVDPAYLFRLPLQDKEKLSLDFTHSKKNQLDTQKIASSIFNGHEPSSTQPSRHFWRGKHVSYWIKMINAPQPIHLVKKAVQTTQKNLSTANNTENLIKYLQNCQIGLRDSFRNYYHVIRQMQIKK